MQTKPLDYQTWVLLRWLTVRHINGALPSFGVSRADHTKVDFGYLDPKVTAGAKRSALSLIERGLVGPVDSLDDGRGCLRQMCLNEDGLLAAKNEPEPDWVSKKKIPKLTESDLSLLTPFCTGSSLSPNWLAPHEVGGRSQDKRLHNASLMKLVYNGLLEVRVRGGSMDLHGSGKDAYMKPSVLKRQRGLKLFRATEAGIKARSKRIKEESAT